MSTAQVPVRYLKLKNEGAYVCHMHVRWRKPGSSSWKSKYVAVLAAGQSHRSDPGDAGAAEGDELSMEIKVVTGKTRRNKDAPLIYSSASKSTAKYTCTGITIDPSLKFKGVSG